MCGIAAVHSNDRPLPEGALERATTALRHRGPDGQRHWTSEDGRVGLAQARLAIIDLVTGDQPLMGGCGEVRLVANGEIYDFEEQRRRLEDCGHRLLTRSDSEVILHLWEDKGPACLHELRGEFAFVLWDPGRRTLFAARDRLGVKPLHWAVHDGRLFLASEAKALFAAGVPAAWDDEAVWQAAHLGAPAPGRSLFRGVRQVPPGHFLISDAAGRRVERWWDLDYPMRGRESQADEGEQIERFSAALADAVRTRLRADVPVGCYLSGGIDSAAVLALAARHSPRPVRAFTIRLEGAGYDESELARDTAARTGAEASLLSVSTRDLADNFGDAAWHAETAFLNGHGVAKFLLSRAVNEAGYKVVLTGEGADELLGGYAHFRRDLLLYSPEGQDPGDLEQLRRWLAAAQTAAPLGDAGEDGLDVLRQAAGVAPTYFTHQHDRARRHAALMYEGAPPPDGEPYSALVEALGLPSSASGRDSFNRCLYLYARTTLPGYVLTVLGDRMEMAHSVEGRLPFLDDKVVDVARLMPPRLKIRGLSEKHALRESARTLVGEEVRQRVKHPFLAPHALLTPGGPLWERVLSALRGPALESIPFYDPKRVAGLLDRLAGLPAAERVALDQVLTFVASLCVLQERFRL